MNLKSEHLIALFTQSFSKAENDMQTDACVHQWAAFNQRGFKAIFIYELNTLL